MFGKLGLYSLWTSFLPPSSVTIASKPVLPPQEQVIYQESHKKAQDDTYIKEYQQKIAELEQQIKELKQTNVRLTTDLKTARQNNTLYYGTLGATVAVSTFVAQCALRFIEPQHTASLKGIATDTLIVAIGGYIGALLGYMHSPTTWRDTTAYRSKIVPSACAAWAGLGTTIALGNAFDHKGI